MNSLIVAEKEKTMFLPLMKFYGGYLRFRKISKAGVRGSQGGIVRKA